LSVQTTLHSPEQAHKAIADIWLKVKASLLAGRKQVLTVTDFQDNVSTQQRKYYHGFVLNEIAKQASIAGRKYNLQIWKEHFRDKFLGDEVVTEINPMTGVEARRLIRKSTEGLGVKGYNLLIDQVTAFAVTELHVNFDLDFDEWVAQNYE
jgi:NinB protein